MIGFRVTKFAPSLRLQDGSFGGEEWTSVSDIGRKFAAGVLTLSDYLATEEAYVETVRRLMTSTSAQFLRVRALEFKGYGNTLPARMVSESAGHLGLLTEGVKLFGHDLDWAVRLNLREIVWCRLEGEGGLYVHFGYDYYMYVGADSAGFELPSLPVRMHAEPILSPYVADE